MNVKISTKNFELSEDVTKRINKKLSKLDKYFDKDVSANVIVTRFRKLPKIEITIVAKQATFRAEAVNKNLYDAIDMTTDKLASQMSRFKGKLETRYKENKALKLEFVPAPEEDTEEDMSIVRRKHVELSPMVADEAVLQMEMLGHDFFVFLDMDTDTVGVVYKRKDGAYGLIETDR